MPPKLSGVLRKAGHDGAVSPTLEEYEALCGRNEQGADATESNEHRTFSNLYYDLVTDFYDYGWGQSYHFAPRVPGESFAASLARHEHYLAHRLGLGPGTVAVDIGCGVGGPMREIARFSGATIVGVNCNAYQLDLALKRTEEAGLSHLNEYLHCDFLDVDAPDNSFDAAFAIEATCHEPDKVRIYGEIFRLLKPGACFAAYEYCTTERFDPGNETHVRLKTDIELNGGLPDIVPYAMVDNALREAGFEVIETRDLTAPTGPSIPWYQPLVGSGISFASFRSSNFGRAVTTGTLRVLETLRIVPRGSVQVVRKLNRCAHALAEAGQRRIFTPMYFLHARKPARACQDDRAGGAG